MNVSTVLCGSHAQNQFLLAEKTLECAMALAVCQFSAGSTFKETLLQALDIDPGENILQEGALKDIKRISSSNKRIQGALKSIDWP